MAGSTFTMNPFVGDATLTQTMARICPLASYCSCPHAQVRSTVGDDSDTDFHSDDLVAEVDSWVNRGWQVIAGTPRRVVLERNVKFAFCTNAALCVVTGMLWLAYWIPRARHPKIDRRVITLSPSGEVSTTRVDTRRG